MGKQKSRKRPMFSLCLVFSMSPHLPVFLRCLGLTRREAHLQNTIGEDSAAGVALGQNGGQQQFALEVADANKEFIAPLGQLDFV